MTGDTFYERLRDMWDDNSFLWLLDLGLEGTLDKLCMVFFSGLLLTRSIRRYRFDNEPWEENPFFGMSIEALDARVEFPSSEVNNQRGRMSWILHPLTGRRQDVTVADIYAAVDADYKPDGKPSEIRVVNKDEIWLYYRPRDKPEIDIGRHVIRRIDGKWQFFGAVTATE